MADFLKRVGTTGKVSWQARVRRKGYPDTCKTFRRKSDAEAWAAGIEADMARMVHVDRRVAERTTLGEALEIYRDEVTAKKAGHQEGYVIAAWLRHPLARRSLASLRTVDFQKWVGERSKTVSSKTLRLNLGPISHLFNSAKALLGIEGLSNPINDLMLPPLPKGRDRRLLVREDGEALFDEEEALFVGAQLLLATIPESVGQGDVWLRVKQGRAHVLEAVFANLPQTRALGLVNRSAPLMVASLSALVTSGYTPPFGLSGSRVSLGWDSPRCGPLCLVIHSWHSAKTS